MNQDLLETVSKLSVDERIRLVGQIWDGIHDELDRQPVPPELEAEMLRRLDHVREHPDELHDWPAVKAEILGALKSQHSKSQASPRRK